MLAGDEFYDDDATSGFDPLGRADFIWDELKNSSSCFTCGSPDPAIIEGRFCCDCTGEWRQGFIDARLARLVRENVGV